MKFPLYAAVAAVALVAGSPAIAETTDVTGQKTSFDQGTLVHANGGGEDVGLLVTGDLGSGPGQKTDYVNFQGSTTATSNTTDANNLRLQNGGGQAELTGAVISGNNFQDLQSGDIFLDNHAGMTWIELALQNIADGDSNPLNELSVTFTLDLLNDTDDFIQTFALSLSGENKFGFLAQNGEKIINLHYVINGGTADSIRQVRILEEGGIVPPIPEPATWMMMLLGFGAIGFSMRRRRQPLLTQLA